MRHRVKDRKLGRTREHRRALLSALVCALIREKRIKTTLVKAKEARSLAEKMITLARKRNLAARRLAIAQLRDTSVVAELFEKIGPQFDGRQGGYTRITKLGQRRSDGSEMALLEWVGIVPAERKKKKKAEAEESKTE